MQGTGLGLLPALLLLPLAAGPAWVGLAYPAAIRKVQARAVLQDGASPWWAPVLGGALWRQILGVPVALLSAWSMGWTLIAEGWAGWGWMAATAVVLWPVAWLAGRPLGAIRPYARLRPVLLIAPPVTAAFLTVAWTLWAGLGTLGEASLAERVAAEPHYEGSSALLAWAVDTMGLWNGARLWALAWAEGEVGPLALFWRVGATFGQFWLAAGVFAAALLPWGEARRILRASAADTPPPVGAGRAAVAALILTVLLGILVSSLAEAEAWASLRQHPMAVTEVGELSAPGGREAGPQLIPTADLAPATRAAAPPTPSALRRMVETEQIGQLACPPGTLDGLEAFDRQIQRILALRRGEVERMTRAGFDAVRARVPVFLDGYYSLTAEYVRTFHLIAGNGEAFLERRMAEALGVDEAFAPLRAAVAALDAPLPADLRTARDRLLAACGDLPSDLSAPVVTARAPGTRLALAPDQETISLKARLTASSAGSLAGGVAGAVAGKLIAKLLAKEAVGLAAEAVAKLAVGKAAGGLGGTAAGAGAGALAGSVVPGVGTTIGAVVGGVLGGLAIGVASDYALLELEEAVSRGDFEAQILSAIDEAEAEVLATLLPPN